MAVLLAGVSLRVGKQKQSRRIKTFPASQPCPYGGIVGSLRCLFPDTGRCSSGVASVLYAFASLAIFFACVPLTFQPVERVPFFPDTSPREERPWNDP